jgi:hypothetical protein
MFHENDVNYLVVEELLISIVDWLHLHA